MRQVKVLATPEYMMASAMRNAAKLTAELRDGGEDWLWPWAILSFHIAAQNAMSLKLKTQEDSGEPVPIKHKRSSGKLRTFRTLYEEMLFRDGLTGLPPEMEHYFALQALNIIRNEFIHPKEGKGATYDTVRLANDCLVGLAALEHVALYRRAIDWGPEITAEEVRELIDETRDNLFALAFPDKTTQPEPPASLRQCLPTSRVAQLDLPAGCSVLSARTIKDPKWQRQGSRDRRREGGAAAAA